MRSSRFVLGIQLLLILGFTAAAESVEVSKVEEKTFRLSPEGSVSVMADEGSIVVQSWDRDQVKLKITKRVWGRSRREAERIIEAIEVRIQESADRLSIREVDWRRGSDFNFFDLFDSRYWRDRNWGSARVDFELTVPRRIKLKLQGDEGDVEVTGAEGEVNVDVDEGDVDLQDIRASIVDVHVDEGDVDLYKIEAQGQASIRVDTDEGRITVEDCTADELDLSSDEGKIVILDSEVLQFWLVTDEGDIEAEFVPMNGGEYRFETDEGDLEISIPRDVNLHVRLRTDEGRVESDFDLNRRRTEDGEIREGIIGREDGSMRAYTSEGDIFLIQRR